MPRKALERITTVGAAVLSATFVALPTAGAAALDEVDADRSAVLVVDGGQTAIEQGGVEAPAVALPFEAEGRRLAWYPLLYGGWGLYHDRRPFFGQRGSFVHGSPLVEGPDPGRRAAFTELALEPGLGVVARLGDAPLYGFGAWTVAATGTMGSDIYRRDAHVELATEKALAGLLWRGGPDDTTWLLRAGRLSLTLDDGLLVHAVRNSSNAGSRRALYLGARTALDAGVTLDVRGKGWRVQAFGLDPDELPSIDGKNRFVGAHVQWNPVRALELAAAGIKVTDSRSMLRTPQGGAIRREGLQTAWLQARWRGALGQEGLLLAAGVGRQGHPAADVRSSAGYLRIGHQWRGAAGRPALEWRGARFSGDRAGTERFERWDPLLAAGSDEWMGGIGFSKFQQNTNLAQDRWRVYLRPAPGVDVTLDAVRYRADELNNLGAGPLGASWPGHRLGDELMLIVRASLGKHLYWQGVAAIARPGAALRQAIGEPVRSWSTLQSSLYWFWP